MPKDGCYSTTDRFTPILSPRDETIRLDILAGGCGGLGCGIVPCCCEYRQKQDSYAARRRAHAERMLAHLSSDATKQD